MASEVDKATYYADMVTYCARQARHAAKRGDVEMQRRELARAVVALQMWSRYEP